MSGTGDTRVRLGFRIALAVVVLAGVGFGVRALVDSHASAQRERHDRQLYARFEQAGRALAAHALPPGVTPDTHFCAGAGSLCGRSSLTPPELKSRLLAFVGRGATPFKSPASCQLKLVGCPTTVVGHFDGFDITAIAFWNLIEVRHGRPPAGAVRVAGTGRLRGHLFYRGSEVEIELDEPRALQAG